jgi:hypothetical protein
MWWVMKENMFQNHIPSFQWQPKLEVKMYKIIIINKNWLLVKLLIAMCSVRFGGLSRSDFNEHKLTGRLFLSH